MACCPGCKKDQKGSSLNFITYDELDWCENCVECFFENCSECGAFSYSVDEKSNIVNGNNVCKKCFEKKFFICEYSNEVFPVEFLFIKGNSKIHIKYKDSTNICMNCKKTFNIEEIEKNGGGCNTCVRSLVKDYKTENKTNFYYAAGEENHIPFGIEIELDFNGSLIKDIAKSRKRFQILNEINNDFDGFFITKFDRTVEAGFEIVSSPATISAQKKYWSKLFSSLKEERDGFFCKKSPNSAMHIHVDRNRLSNLQRYKIIGFYNNLKNKQFIEMIAGRKINKYCSIINNLDILPATFGGILRGNHRSAICFPSSKNTIEFRAFHGTLDKFTFNKNIEFILALIKFSETESLSGAIEKDNLIKFISNNSYLYPSLYLFLVGKKVINTSKAINCKELMKNLKKRHDLDSNIKINKSNFKTSSSKLDNLIDNNGGCDKTYAIISRYNSEKRKNILDKLGITSE